MRFGRIVAVLMVLVILSGCERGKEPTQEALDFRVDLMQAQGCGFQADIVTDYGDKTYSFTVDARYTPEETTVTVVSPESIAGIAAVVSGDEAKLKYDDMELALGDLANGMVAPMSVPWILGHCWMQEYISASGQDGQLRRVTYLRGYEDEELTVDTWFDPNNVPVYAEIVYDGRRCVCIDIQQFGFKENI